MTHVDEHTLRALFEELDAPAAIDDRWRTKAALAVLEAPAEPGAVRLPDIAPRRVSGWTRLAAAGIAALVTAAIAVGVVASNRLPPTDPRPNPSETITFTPAPPTSVSVPPSEGVPPEAGTGTLNPGLPAGQQPPPAGAQPKPGGPGTSQGNPVIPPARGPLTDWPDQQNAGVTPGTKLRSQPGDLHVTAPGTIVYDLKVNGTVFVEAPDVTLRRVQALGVQQRAPRLTVEDSEVGREIVQETAGLTIRRSAVSGVESLASAGNVTIVDSYLGSMRVNGASAQVLLRHNTVRFASAITLDDSGGAVIDATLDNNRLPGDGTSVWAPTGPDSRDIHLRNNKFYGSTSGRPVNGWNPQGSGNTWSGNVWEFNNEPVYP